MKTDFRSRQHSDATRALRLTLTFLVVSVVWIVVTDRAAEWLFAEHATHLYAQTAKGLLYVAVTTGLVFWLSIRAFRHVSQRASEQQILKTEQLLQTVMENLGEAVIMVDSPTRTIVRCNAAVELMFGYSPNELIGETTQVLHQNREAFDAFARRGEPELERKGAFRCEQTLKHRDGSALQTEITVVALEKELGWRAGVASVIRDVTDQREAEAALRKSEKRYRLLADHTLDIIWEMDPKLVFTYVNPAIEKVTGHSPSEFTGTHLREHVGPDGLRKLEGLVRDEISRGPDGEGVVVEMDILRKDGSSVAAEVHGRVIFGEDGEPVAIQGTTRDISHRRALEAEVRQSLKLQAIGTFAGGVAHEINNPIMGISGYTQIIADSAGKDSQTQEYCSEIQKETTRIHDLIKDLLGYARTEEDQPPQRAALSAVVDSTLSLVRTAIRHDNIALSVEIPDDLPEIRCRRQQIQQVVMNLVTNARDAINSKYPNPDDNKRITISAQPVEMNDEQWIRLAVHDTGIGIPEDVQQRIYDPFFTTKGEGEGTGLGMWIVYRIVQDHGGNIAIETEPGEFTRFNIDLPIA